jgi:hypothetical protein
LKVSQTAGLFAGGAAGGVIEPDLFGLEAWGRLPVKGTVHDLPHLVEPPVGALETAFALDDPRATIRSRQSQFHLICILHISSLSLNVVSSLAGEVGQGVSKQKYSRGSRNTLRINKKRIKQHSRTEVDRRFGTNSPYHFFKTVIKLLCNL